ncbi:MAG: helicase C-terminal domain-containing protein [Acholeplasmataceae bacterium]
MRTSTDRGVAVLIDDRFARPSYQKLFPPEWKERIFVGSQKRLCTVLKRFWDEA